MVNVADAVAVLYPSAVPFTDYEVRNNGSGDFISSWNTAKLGTKPTVQQLAAVTDAQVTAYYTGLQRTAADNLLADPSAQNKVMRAVLLVNADYLNLLQAWEAAAQTWITQYTAAVAAATSLANLQSRVAALTPPGTPPVAVTAANAKAAVKNKIDGGQAD